MAIVNEPRSLGPNCCFASVRLRRARMDGFGTRCRQTSVRPAQIRIMPSDGRPASQPISSLNSIRTSRCATRPSFDPIRLFPNRIDRRTEASERYARTADKLRSRPPPTSDQNKTRMQAPAASPSRVPKSAGCQIHMVTVT